MDDATVAPAAAEEVAQRNRIAEVRPAREGEMFTPDTPWRRQDTTPRAVPELDADGKPWQITGDGRHVGTHNGTPYCLEWLPVPFESAIRFGPEEGLNSRGRQASERDHPVARDAGRAEYEAEAGG